MYILRFLPTDGSSIYNESQARKEALSRWIEEESETRISEEVEHNKMDDADDDDAYLQNIFSHLTGRQIDEACSLAQEKGELYACTSKIKKSQSCTNASVPT